MLRRCRHDFAAHPCAAGKKDRIEFFAQHRSGNRLVALHNGNKLQRKNFTDQARDRRCGMRRKF